MTAPITTLRTTIANALVNNNKWQTFDFVPATILPNSVIVAWGEPMLEMENNQYSSISPMANIRILMTVPLIDNQGNLSYLEDMITDVFNLLAASSLKVKVERVSSPSVLQLASGDLLTADIVISTLTSWS